MFSRLITSLQRLGIFDICIRILIIVLPFTTLLTVMGKIRLGIPYIGFYKEIILMVLILVFFWNVWKKKLTIKLSMIDWIIGLYIANLLLVSIFTTGIRGIIYGGRYDFSFLIIFWILYHGFPLLKEGLVFYLKLFILSTGMMLFLSALLKYPFSEDLLLYLGYGGNPSNWDFSGVPPIFHGIDGANVRRFQGILDGPNTMGAFLVFFIGIFAYYFRGFKKWYFVNGGIILVLIILVLYTYSRSAALGLACGISIVIIGSLGYIFRKHKKEFIVISLFGVFLSGMIYIQYADRIGSIIGRAGSTKGHFERMTVGIERFASSPLGQGLGSAGPGYRYVQNLGTIQQDVREEKDRFYIPESWYIQQFIEGGLIGGLIFLGIMLLMFIKLYKKHIFLGGMFAGIVVMNLFLHTFESSPFSLLFFAIIGIILGSQLYAKGSQNR